MIELLQTAGIMLITITAIMGVGIAIAIALSILSDWIENDKNSSD